MSELELKTTKEGHKNWLAELSLEGTPTLHAFGRFLVGDLNALLARVEELQAEVEELKTPDLAWDLEELETASDSPFNVLFNQQDPMDPDRVYEIAIAKTLPTAKCKIIYNDERVMVDYEVIPEKTNDKA